jgi:hypothetical protein
MRSSVDAWDGDLNVLFENASRGDVVISRADLWLTAFVRLFPQGLIVAGCSTGHALPRMRHAGFAEIGTSPNR